MGRQTSERAKAPDPEETVTYVAPATVRGSRTLCLAAGFALAVQHILTGLLATPFFGSEAFFWGNVLGAFMLSVGLGFAVGDRLGLLLGGAPRGPWRLLAIGSALVAVATWGLPWVARLCLDRDPDSPLAPTLTMLPLLVIPGALLASVVPSAIPGLGAPVEPGKSPAQVAREAIRRFALSLGGGLVGLGLASYGLLHAEKAKVWLQLTGMSCTFVVLAVIGLSRWGKLLAAFALAGIVGLVTGLPSEIQKPEYEKALSEEVLIHGAGRYYARTASEHVLTGTELERKLNNAERRLQGADKRIAVLLVVETVKTMGPLNISGFGLKGMLDIYLPPQSKPLILPFVEKIRSVHSDDGRKYHFEIQRESDGHAHFKIPGKKPDDPMQEFEITDDFDLQVTSEGSKEEITRFTIGPQHLEVGIINDTIKTPLLCKNVALWIDASLLSIEVKNEPQLVSMYAQAQASIGAPQKQLLQQIDKTKMVKQD